jgi:DNA-directed RNA polymerase omega subunit
LGRTKVSLESLYDKTGSIYKLVVLASRRALELNAGAAQLTQEQKENIIETALQEIAEGKVGFKLKKS